MKIILEDPNCVYAILVIIFFYPNYGVHPWKQLFFGVH